jgi:hypothetical protein
MLTSEAVLETVQQRGYEAVVSGEVTPNVRDLLAASAAIREIEREAAGEFSTAELLCQLDTVIQIIREVVPPELHAVIAERIEAEQRRSLTPPTPDPTWDDIVGEMDEDGIK